MKLNDWLIKPTTEIVETIAIHGSKGVIPIAEIATVAGGETKNFTSEKGCAREQLLKMHPAIVEGCRIGDILDKADPQDFEDLKDPDILKQFAISLRTFGEIQPIKA